MAATGAEAKANEIVAALARKYPADTFLNSVALPAFRAAIELKHGNPKKAVELLESAKAYDRNTMPVLNLRANAFLQSGDPVAAAQEFKKVLSLKLLAPESPQLPLAQLGLARAYAQQRDTAQSQNAYQDLLAMWKDADPDLPLPRQARAEYARLK